MSLPGIDGTTRYVSEKDFLLSISDLDLHFEVTSAKVEKNNWPLSKTGLIHISSTPLPGEIGNSIIYGHNWPNILGNLHSVKTGQKITVKVNSQEHVFVVTSVAKVSPQDTQLLKDTSTSVLTIYTCTGFLDSQRLVVTADKIS